jgi:hypothetical protein
MNIVNDIGTLEIGTVLTQAQMMNIATKNNAWDGSVDIITAMDFYADAKGFMLVCVGDKDIFVKSKKVVDKLATV